MLSTRTSSWTQHLNDNEDLMKLVMSWIKVRIAFTRLSITHFKGSILESNHHLSKPNIHQSKSLEKSSRTDKLIRLLHVTAFDWLHKRFRWSLDVFDEASTFSWRKFLEISFPGVWGVKDSGSVWWGPAKTGEVRSRYFADFQKSIRSPYLQITHP